ncbi:MAG TPA: hypothetical protein VF791_20960 [Pyrinomonadaceae bacterium]
MGEDRNNTGAAAAAAKQAGTQPPRGDVKEQRGGMQADQIVGQTSKGAQTEAKENRNPQGNDPDQNRSARQEGNEL